MTESDWITGPNQQVQRAIFALGPRRQRLLAVAACRVLGERIDYPAVRAALDAAETFADTGKSKAALRRARQSVVSLRNELYASRAQIARAVGLSLFAVQVAASENAVFGTIAQILEALAIDDVPPEVARQRVYGPYREIAGPLTPLAFAPAWRTDTAVLLAKQMYEARDFSAMPILADALQDAGCDSPDILDHCRGAPGVHIRGCWVVDLVLGKG